MNLDSRLWRIEGQTGAEDPGPGQVVIIEVTYTYPEDMDLLGRELGAGKAGVTWRDGDEEQQADVENLEALVKALGKHRGRVTLGPTQCRIERALDYAACHPGSTTVLVRQVALHLPGPRCCAERALRAKTGHCHGEPGSPPGT